MAADERMAVQFFPVGDADGLADCLIRLLASEEKQHEMAEQNFSAALRMAMPQIIREYLRSFDLQQRTRSLMQKPRFGLQRWSGSSRAEHAFRDWAPWAEPAGWPKDEK
jgi:hypothetical protein